MNELLGDLDFGAETFLQDERRRVVKDEHLHLKVSRVFGGCQQLALSPDQALHQTVGALLDQFFGPTVVANILATFLLNLIFTIPSELESKRLRFEP